MVWARPHRGPTSRIVEGGGACDLNLRTRSVLHAGVRPVRDVLLAETRWAEGFNRAGRHRLCTVWALWVGTQYMHLPVKDRDML